MVPNLSSADSQALTYAPTQGPSGTVWVQPIDGSPPRQITEGNLGRIFSVGWSKDGKKLIYGSGAQTSDVISIGQ